MCANFQKNLTTLTFAPKWGYFTATCKRKTGPNKGFFWQKKKEKKDFLQISTKKIDIICSRRNCESFVGTFAHCIVNWTAYCCNHLPWRGGLPGWATRIRPGLACWFHDNDRASINIDRSECSLSWYHWRIPRSNIRAN